MPFPTGNEQWRGAITGGFILVCAAAHEELESSTHIGKILLVVD